MSPTEQVPEMQLQGELTAALVRFLILHDVGVPEVESVTIVSEPLAIAWVVACETRRLSRS